MQLTLIQSGIFDAEWRALRLTDDDLQSLESMLLANPTAGAVMAGTGGLRKMRFAPPSRRAGKSGANRVGYVYFVRRETVVLLTIFAKSEKAHLTRAERAAFKSLVAAYEKELK